MRWMMDVMVGYALYIVYQHTSIHTNIQVYIPTYTGCKAVDPIRVRGSGGMHHMNNFKTVAKWCLFLYYRE